MVIDFRGLKAITDKDRHPLPNQGEMQDRLRGSKWFTKIDLRDAFYAVRMAEGEEWKTAFRTRYGLFEFCVMPMGLTNAPATLQALVNNILRDLLDITVIAYVDDILIFTKGSRDDHSRDVNEVFERLSKVDFKTAPEKCEFYKQEVDFLGFVINTTRFKVDPKKTTSIKEWPTPKTVKDVQSFLGLANYNKKFVQDYSRIATPLTNLTRKDTPFVWGPNQKKAFEQLKEASVNSPALRMFDTKRPIQIETDAFDRAIGACLTQEFDGTRHPIAYVSREMSSAEQNYEINRRQSER